MPELRRVAAAGLDLAYRELGAGRPTLVLHGGGPGCAAWTDFAPVAEALAPGRRLIFLDLPQFGESPVPVIGEPVFGYHAGQVLAVLDRLGLAEVDLVCQSFGGSVALRLAALAPNRVGRIVATGSAPTPPDGGVTGPAIRDAYYGGDGPSEAKMAELIGAYEWHDRARIPAETVRARYRASVRPEYLAVATDTAARGAPEDLAGLLPRVDRPVLLLWGAGDPFAGPSYALGLTRLLPRADLHVLARTSHHPQQERPRAYAAAVRAFLDR